MAIQPPSDLLVDVMQAADPSRAQKVTSNLQRLSTMASASSGVFDTMVAGTRAGVRAAGGGGMAFSSTSTTTLGNMTTLARRPGAEQLDPSAPLDAFKDNPLRKFEAMVLSSFVETMLPSKATAVYGSGNAGGIWRTMLAQKIGDQVAQAGGIGIAKQIAASHPDMAKAVSGGQNIPVPQSVPAARAADAADAAGPADAADTERTPSDIIL
ncbi:rod-binding protein [Xanthobacteraceae bacterium A53D]